MKRNEINGTFLSADPSLKNTALVWGTIKGGVVEPLGHMISTTDKVKGEKVMIDMVNRARKTIENILDEANEAYYNTGQILMKDEDFDYIKDFLIEKFSNTNYKKKLL